MTANRSVPRRYRRGVGVMLVNREGRVFVARRADFPGPAWQMPQGGIDEGETPRAAALRELREEVGTDRVDVVCESARWRRYDIPDGLASRLWGGAYRGQNQKWFLARFAGEDKDIDITAHHAPEFLEWKWARLEELPDLIVPFKRRLYEDLVAEFRPWIEAALAKT